MGDSIVGYFVRFQEGEPARSAAQLATHRAHATTTALWLHPTRGFIRRGGFSGRSDSLAEIGRRRLASRDRRRALPSVRPRSMIALSSPLNDSTNAVMSAEASGHAERSPLDFLSLLAEASLEHIHKAKRPRRGCMSRPADLGRLHFHLAI